MDLEVCAQVRRSLEEAGENGLDMHDLHEALTDLHVPQSGRTRSLEQYMKVNACTARINEAASLPSFSDCLLNPHPRLFTSGSTRRRSGGKSWEHGRPLGAHAARWPVAADHKLQAEVAFALPAEQAQHRLPAQEKEQKRPSGDGGVAG